jgi:hypothetical protein
VPFDSSWWRAHGEAELNQLLYWRWDPLGVSDMFPDTIDEYTGYAAPIARLAAAGVGVEAIAAQLREFETNDMGHASGREEARAAVAQAIVAWYAASIG